jgi:seryl-tRNA synthetase
MLQVNFIKHNRENVIARLAVKHFKEPELIDKIIDLDDERKKLQFDYDEAQSKINIASREIGQLMAKGDANAANKNKQQVLELKNTLQPINEKLSQIEKSLHDELLKVPNLPHASVPEGKTPEENIIVKEYGNKPTLHAAAIPHWELAIKYDLINFELGNKITGSGFPVYINKGAKLQRALIQYFLDYNTTAGYIEYSPPYMVNEVNSALEANPELVNTDPYGQGWMIKMTVDNTADVEQLMDTNAYQKLVG